MPLSAMIQNEAFMRCRSSTGTAFSTFFQPSSKVSTTARAGIGVRPETMATSSAIDSVR